MVALHPQQKASALILARKADLQHPRLNILNLLPQMIPSTAIRDLFPPTLRT